MRLFFFSTFWFVSTCIHEEVILARFMIKDIASEIAVVGGLLWPDVANNFAGLVPCATTDCYRAILRTYK